jgi:hypothetical protein
MSFGPNSGNISGGFNSEKTKSTTTRDATSLPIVPDWILGPVSGAFGHAQTLGAQDPSSYVAGVDPLQQAAHDTAAGLGNQSQWNAAVDLTRSALQSGPAGYSAESLLTGLDKYQNPYLKDVVGSALADYDAGAARTRAQQDLNLAGNFGGSGDAITRSLTEGELARGRASLTANLYSDAFNNAAYLSNLDAQRRQQAGAGNASYANAFNSQKLAAAAQLGDLASGFGADTRANTQLQSDVGTLFRGIDSEQRRGPLELAQWENQQYGTLPSSLFAGEHTTSLENTKTKKSGFSLSGSLGFG